MDIQVILVMAIVAAAIGYVGFRLYQNIFRRKSCDHGDCCSPARTIKKV